ncbi:hypothetical protein Rmf_24020 [Roseomonas fluvialis]|uniref:OmpR/PhoB-type domain-containing protein n=2 Tax=Roseomonas fluvialis TaxID=1750527 RepID=A0ABN6P3B7_9PROT|nr:hypothetical protein Rmf_24020 [Roseomonas fluvialis]
MLHRGIDSRFSKYMSKGPSILLFEGYAFDPAAGLLWVNGAPLTLRPKAADVLGHLLRHAGTLVTRQDLLDAVWPGIAVVDDGLTQCVTDIRQALGPDGPRLLRTVRGRGYIFAASVTQGAAPSLPRASRVPLLPLLVAAPGHSRMVWTVAVLALGTLAFPLAALMPRPAPAPVAVPMPTPDARLVAHRLLEHGLTIQRGPGTFEERLRSSLPFFRDAFASDPTNAAAAAEAAFVHGNLLTVRGSTNIAFDRAELDRYADLAMAANAADPKALNARAIALRHAGRYAEALPFYRLAGADPERASARANVGLMLLLLGDPDAAIEPLRGVLAESPRHVFAGTWRLYLALAELLAGRPGFGEALFDPAGPTRAFMPRGERLLYRAAALAMDGQEDAAREVLAEIQRRWPDVLARPLRDHAMSAEPAFLALYDERFVAPLMRLGLR